MGLWRRMVDWFVGASAKHSTVELALETLFRELEEESEAVLEAERRAAKSVV